MNERYINGELYKKAYLLTVEKDQVIEKAFTFSVPPESEEFTYTHRISQTKTFGGICVDRYGLEPVKISLSGSTINQEVKFIYGGGLSNRELTGEEEIFEIRDILNYAGNERKAVMKLYDLSKTKSVNKTSKYNSGQCWTVYLDNFKIKRSHDKPLTYQYTIEFTGIELQDNKQFELVDKKTPRSELLAGENKDYLEDVAKLAEMEKQGEEAINKAKENADKAKKDVTENKVVKFIKNSPAAILNGINYATDAINLGCTTMSQVLDKSKGIGNYLSSVSQAIQNFENSFTRYSDVIANYNNLTDNMIKETIGLGKVSISSTVNIILDVGNTIAQAADTVLKNVSAFKRAYEDLKEDKYGFSNLFDSERLNALNMTVAEVENTLDYIMNVMSDGASELVAELKKESFPLPVVFTGPEGNDTVIIVSGYTEGLFRDGDSWETIAAREYGSVDYAPFLAAYNNISDEGIATGNGYKLPKLSETEMINLGNNIFSSGDNMGKDISLDENGDLKIKDGDLDVIEGTENLNQALLLRLSTYLGSDVRKVLYGVKNTVGEANASNAFLLSSIRQTLNNEPRIKTINTISYVGQGNNIAVTVNFTDINEQKRVFAEVI